MSGNNKNEPDFDKLLEERPDGAREFRFWNLDDVLFTHTIGLFGRRGSGKTSLTMNVLESKKLPRGIVMCPTPEAVIVYGENIPLSYIFDYFDEGIIIKICGFQNALKLRLHHQYRQEIAQIEANSIIDRKTKWMDRMQALKQRQTDENLSARQVQIIYEREILEEEFENQQNLEMRKSYARTRKLQLQEPYCMFCVLDDLSSDREAMRSQVLKKLMDNGRHYLMLLIIACQYSMDFPASCRGGLDWVVLWYDTLAPNLKRLYENYVGEFPDRHIFAEALAECARRNCCLVINKRSRSPDLYDSVFLFQTKEVWLSTKSFGDPQYEWVHNMFFNEAKFLDNQSGGGNMKVEEKKKGKKISKAPSKSFSIESIEKKQGGHGKRGAKGSNAGGIGGGGGGIGSSMGGKGKKKSSRTESHQPSTTNKWGDDEEDDFDPEEDRRKEEKKKVNQNVRLLRKNLDNLGKQQQAQLQAKALSQSDDQNIKDQSPQDDATPFEYPQKPDQNAQHSWPAASGWSQSTQPSPSHVEWSHPQQSWPSSPPSYPVVPGGP